MSWLMEEEGVPLPITGIQTTHRQTDPPCFEVNKTATVSEVCLYSHHKEKGHGKQDSEEWSGEEGVGVPVSVRSHQIKFFTKV